MEPACITERVYKYFVYNKYISDLNGKVSFTQDQGKVFNLQNRSIECSSFTIICMNAAFVSPLLPLLLMPSVNYCTWVLIYCSVIESSGKK